jgi:heme exporter protein B
LRDAYVSAGAVWAILAKEWRSEWRTRYSLNAALLFTVASLTVVSFSTGRVTGRADLLSAFFWLVVLFAALAGLGYGFVREVESHTMTTLRMAAPPTAIALGKLLFNWMFLLLLELVAVPLYLILMAPPAPHWGPFLAVLGLASVGLAAAATLVAAIIAQSRMKGALFAAISLPIVLPVLAAAVSGTRAQWEGASVLADVGVLAAYAAAIMAASLLLYDHLWGD